MTFLTAPVKIIATILLSGAYLDCLIDELQNRKNKRFIIILTLAYAALIAVVVI